MGTGYTRNDGSNNIADGNVINASDLDGEFDAVVSAFSTSGHTHDGTAAEGGPVTVLGPVQDFVATATEIKPKTTNTLSIGTASLQFKDLYIDGTAYIDGIGEDTLVATDKKVQFRDSALSINSSTDGQLDIDADTTLQITAPTVDIDASTAVTISNDLKLNNDDAVLGLGADNDVTLTHIPDTGVRLNTTSAVQFRDSALSINSSTDGQLDIDADTEIEITAPTVDLTASTAVTVSNDLKLASDAAVLGFGADNDVTLTHVHNTGVLLNDAMAIQIRDSGLSINSSADGQLDIDADTEIEITTGTLDINATTTDISGALDVNGALTASDTVDIQATHPTGTSNVGFGSGTFANIEAGGTLNTAMGVNALQDLTTGDSNTAIGYQAALNATTPVGTTAIGREAIGVGVLTGDYNTAIGYQAGYDLTSGVYNNFIGYKAGFNATTANNAIAIGRDAIGLGVLTGTDNTAIGQSAGNDLTSGIYNVMLGYRAGYNATEANDTIAIGRQAIGLGVLTGERNIAIGRLAGNDLTSGNYNAFMGYNTGGNATTAQFNTAIGYSTIGVGVLTGTDNIAIGRQAGNDLTSGNYNVAVGYRAGYELTTGVDNTLLGVQAGDVLTTGSNNTIIGHDAAASAADVSNEITLGNTSITAIRAQVTSITALSDRRDKKDIKDLSVGLDFVNSLNPVEFTWNMRDGAKVGQKEAGFIAQELDEAQQDAGVDEVLNLVLKSNPDRLEATQGKLIPVLVKAIQELSAEVKALKLCKRNT